MSLLESLLSHGVIERLGWMLVHFLWQAAAIAMLLAALLKLLRRAGADLRYVVACGALTVMIAMPLVTIQFIDISGSAAEAGLPPETQTPTAAPIPVTVQRADELPPLSPAPPSGMADPTAPISWHKRLATALEPTLPYFVLGWLGGVFGLSAWHLGGWAQLQRLKHRMVRRADATLHTTLDELTIRLRVRRVVALLESALVEVPTVVGWLRPTILLPASALTGLSLDQLRAILAHELAHVRRYDYLANTLQTVIEILGFYHPAVWWVSRHIRIERENCCDDLAVRICDNSLQYARALASMEEIRHSRTELAMTASGGSLMARIARLLGRPAGDDRRFAWLPGLIALLLVIGIVIPAAFALTHAAPRGPESAVDTTATSVEEIQDVADPREAPLAHIQVSFTLAELYADAVLDPQVAEDVAGLLVRIGANGGSRRDGESLAPPTIEELRRPLADVLSAFTPAPGRGKEFVNLLSHKKDCVARLLSAPRVTSLSGESFQFTMGDIPGPDKPLPQDPEFVFARCAMTATEVPDQNTVRMNIDMVRMYPAYKPSDPNGQTATWALDTTVLAPNNQWMTITDNRLKRLDRSGRECIQLLLVLATVVGEPETETAGNAMMGGTHPTTSVDQIVHLPPGMGSIHPTTPADEPNRTQVLMAFTIIDVFADRVLDGDTAVRARDFLTLIRPADANGPVTSAELPTLEDLQAPLRDVFARFEPIHLKSKDLTDLLTSRGYGRVMNNPRIQTLPDETVSVMIGQEDDLNAPGSRSTGEYMKKTDGHSSYAGGSERHPAANPLRGSACDWRSERSQQIDFRHMSHLDACPSQRPACCDRRQGQPRPALAAALAANRSDKRHQASARYGAGAQRKCEYNHREPVSERHVVDVTAGRSPGLERSTQRAARPTQCTAGSHVSTEDPPATDRRGSEQQRQTHRIQQALAHCSHPGP